MTEKKGGINPVAAGVAGAAIGAAAASAAVVLSDEKNRKKVGKLFDKVKVEGQKAFDMAKNEAKKLQDMRAEQEAGEPKKLKGKTVKSKATKKS